MSWALAAAMVVGGASPDDVWLVPAEPPALVRQAAPGAVDWSDVAAAVERALADPRLGEHVAIAVRDVSTGAHLYDARADDASEPASTMKLLSMAAVATEVNLDESFVTSVVLDGDRLVLRAGGDTLLGRGVGDPDATLGRAGLSDLAARVAQELTRRGVSGPLRLDVDLTLAPGPLVAPGWVPQHLVNGWVARIAMLGLADQLAMAGTPAAKDPPLEVAAVLRAHLVRKGVRIVGAAPRVRHTTSSDVVGEVRSAPVRDHVAHALTTSDNALTESLARYAAAHDGVDTREPGAVTGWVQQRLAELGIDLTGVDMKDCSGLTEDQTVPARVLADVLQMAATGQHSALTDAFGGLPVAHLTGTLEERFHLAKDVPSRGYVRAKTGSLRGVTALAGVALTEDGRTIVFAIQADRLRPGQNVIEARSALDSVVNAVVEAA